LDTVAALPSSDNVDFGLLQNAIVIAALGGIGDLKEQANQGCRCFRLVRASSGDA
jgi:hypothetical protein